MKHYIYEAFSIDTNDSRIKSDVQTFSQNNFIENKVNISSGQIVINNVYSHNQQEGYHKYNYEYVEEGFQFGENDWRYTFPIYDVPAEAFSAALTENMEEPIQADEYQFQWTNTGSETTNTRKINMSNSIWWEQGTTTGGTFNEADSLYRIRNSNILLCLIPTYSTITLTGTAVNGEALKFLVRIMYSDKTIPSTTFASPTFTFSNNYANANRKIIQMQSLTAYNANDTTPIDPSHIATAELRIAHTNSQYPHSYYKVYIKITHNGNYEVKEYQVEDKNNVKVEKINWGNHVYFAIKDGDLILDLFECQDQSLITYYNTLYIPSDTNRNAQNKPKFIPYNTSNT